MNPTSHNPESKFPFSSGHTPMDNRSLYLTLAASACVAFLVILVLYVSVFRLDPLARAPYGFFMSVLPALGALLVVKLTRVFVSWRGAVTVYAILFVLTLFIQGFARKIPV